MHLFNKINIDISNDAKDRLLLISKSNHLYPTIAHLNYAITLPSCLLITILCFTKYFLNICLHLTVNSQSIRLKYIIKLPRMIAQSQSQVNDSCLPCLGARNNSTDLRKDVCLMNKFTFG